VAKRPKETKGPKRNPEKRQDVDKAIAPPPRIGQIHQAEIQGPREYPGRLTARINPDLHLPVERYSEADRMSVSEFVNKAVEEYLIGRQEKSAVTPDNDKVVLDSPQEIITFSSLIIAAAKEAIEYAETDRPGRNSQPPPLLPREYTPEYLQELRRLVVELERLNKTLEAAAAAPTPQKRKRAATPAAKKSAVDVKRHLNTFLDKYAQSLGKGAAALTVGTVSALLVHFGVPADTFVSLIKSLKQ
jgi:hypothetical protein